MKNIIEIERLNFSYGKNLVINDLTLNIPEGSFTTILGLNGSGKTTIIKLILGLIRGNSVIMCDNAPVTNEKLTVLRKEIGVVFENIENCFVNETVMDEIAFTLENLNLDRTEISRRVTSIANKLKLKKILERSPEELNYEDKWLTALASALVINPKILIIDNGFIYLNHTKKKIVLDLLRRYNKKGMTIINATSDPNEALYGDNVVILNGGKAILVGTKEEIFNEEKILDKAGIKMPFMIELSDKLKFYDLIDKTYFDEEKLVDELWQ